MKPEEGRRGGQSSQPPCGERLLYTERPRGSCPRGRPAPGASSPTLTGTKAKTPGARPRAVVADPCGWRKPQNTIRMHIKDSSFASLLNCYVHTQPFSSQISPLIRSPGANIVKQCRAARAPPALKGWRGVRVRGAFRGTRSRGKLGAVRKQALSLNIPTSASSLIAQNSCHLSGEAINIRHHKDAFGHPGRNQCRIILVYYSS